MNTSAVLIAAPKSGSGKTTIACALMQALKQRGMQVNAFKCGPDYIDPMFHQRVIGVPSRNLDTFFSGEEQIRELFALGRKDQTFSVIEGVMGLYDGLGGTQKEGSAYHLAQVLDIPVVLVLDTKGMGRTMIPVLAGILSYDTDHRIAGVILNRTTASFCKTITPLIQEELRIPVLGFFPNRKDMMLESRHLGLKLPNEIEKLREQLKCAADQLEESVSVARLLELLGFCGQPEGNTGMGESGEMPEFLNLYGERSAYISESKPGGGKGQGVRIAVARDEAFCFYYEDNLRLLREAGAELIPFSPLHDRVLPERISGILLGGGYPELRLRELSENKSMREQIRRAISEGIPSVAECGGFMYLHEYMEDEAGQRYPMAGVIPGGCRNKGKLVRFGYVTVTEKQPFFLAESGVIKAHEFHYFDSDSNGGDCVAQKPVSGRSWECIHEGRNHWWGFPHLYYPSNPEFARRFVAMCRAAGQRKYGVCENAGTDRKHLG